MQESSVRIWTDVLAALMLIAAYTIIYLVEPFSDVWNVILPNSLLVIASSLTATIATMIWARYDRSDIPRRVWGYFAFGLWLWAAAELTWGYLNVTQGEVPEGISDVFWISAYLFFGTGIIVSVLILAPSDQTEVKQRLIAIVPFVAFYPLIYRALIFWRYVKVLARLSTFYPAADLLRWHPRFACQSLQGGAFSVHGWV
jgi:hypothetical protein